MASLSDVAKVAGVSLTTASLVLNRPKQPNRVSEACAQRVREAAKKVGYIPNYHARSMKLGRAETIAVAMDVGTGQGADTVSELTDAYFNHLIGGIELHLRSVGTNDCSGWGEGVRSRCCRAGGGRRFFIALRRRMGCKRRLAGLRCLIRWG